MKLWDSVISDCRTCLELSPENMKAFYYLSQAEIELRDFNEALDHALRAHHLCVKMGDKSLSAITAQVLRCKKERWDDMEKQRNRQGGELETIVLALMERERDEVLADSMSAADRSEISDEWAEKLAHLKTIFEKARLDDEKRREVPDWAVDDITFGIMVDPVIVRISSAACRTVSRLTSLSRPRPASPTSGHRSWSI